MQYKLKGLDIPAVLMCIIYEFDAMFLWLCRLCNMNILSQVQQVICFAFHDSKLLMETCREAKKLRKIVTLFYLD